MTLNNIEIIDSLVSIGAVKFGEFILKSGVKSPIYIDLRITISFPKLLNQIADALVKLSADLTFDKIAGIPYTALPIATAFSLLSGKPMIYSRKEKKAYGTSNQIEGIWKPGETVLIIDDLITNGESKFETFSLFEKAGLIIKDTIVLIDRKQGGSERLEKEGYRLFSIISISEILERMKETNQISEFDYNKVKQFLLAANV
ncbi:orotate phosphoribosyltransferase [bacterium]|nr:orotate phosphoribosyltransferase [bacterium]